MLAVVQQGGTKTMGADHIILAQADMNLKSIIFVLNKTTYPSIKTSLLLQLQNRNIPKLPAQTNFAYYSNKRTT